VLVYKTNNSIVGACFASHFPTDRYEFAGNLGWLAVDPEHRGMNLGELLVGKVVNRLKKAGYKLIYLGTQDFRVPAIKLYFKTGWSPNLYNEEMSIRWKKICKQLNIEFKEEEWSITK
jgi:mycothiol synthase